MQEINVLKFKQLTILNYNIGMGASNLSLGTILTRFYYGSRSIFELKYMFFQLFFTIKVNLIAKIMQSAYLCVIFHVKHSKSPFLAVFTRFCNSW